MTKIYYFSGTGNTYWSAKKLTALLGDAEFFPISREMRQPSIRIEAETVVFVFPAYAYETPIMVRRFLERAEINTNYIAALVTCGSSPGGALAEVRRVLRRKGLTLNFADRIPCVQNYIPIFGVPTAKKQAVRIALRVAATERAAGAITARAVNKVWTLRPFSKIVSMLFRLGRPLFVTGFRRTSDCTRCGLCARLCPAGAIKMTAEGPVFQKTCEHCQSCLNFCPCRAISYIRLKPNTPRYHHPEVTAEDLCRKIVQ
ncbi:iron-sulfur protein [Spirochaetia bacterium]|nr:iron-sulfur protein [Spirochaetia bacterium]